MSFGCTPTVCLATGIVNLSTVISSPASCGSAEFLRVLFYHMVQNLRDRVTPAGLRLVRSSIGMKVWSEFYWNCWFLLFIWVVQGLRDGVTLWRVEFAMWAYALYRNKGLFSEPYSKILWVEVTLWVKCGGRFTLDHERRFSLVVRPRSFRMGSPF